MLGPFVRFLSSCGNSGAGAGGPAGQADPAGAGEGRDGLLWWRDLGRCSAGEFSIAVIQANQVLEDQSRVESGSAGTLAGVFDGHGGHTVARYACDHLLARIQEIVSRPDEMSAEAVRQAFLDTEEGWFSIVSQHWDTQPNIATVGTCCLVGVICQRTLYVANLGDSRAVLGQKVSSTGEIAAISLSVEHNANNEVIRQELQDQHPFEPDIVVLKHGVWRVKGIIQISRSIGDVYLKDPKYNREPINPKFRVAEPFRKPVLSADPSIITHSLQESDCFVIFASDGLWEHLSNQEAVEIVHNNPRTGSARRLIKAALQEAARKREMRYSDLKKIDKKVRRHFHDDITVIVVFFNHDLLSRGRPQVPHVSVRCALDNCG